MDQSKKPFYDQEVILSFFDTLIYGRDLALLQDKHWVNDVIIGFHNEYLEKFVYEEKRSELILIHPDVVFACLSGDASSAEAITQDLKLPEKKYIFLPVNNNSNVDAAGGTHWSLLIYHRPDNTFYHLDSWCSNNSSQARHLADLMVKALAIAGSPAFVERPVPQQHNGFDCGMYVICFSELVCGEYFGDRDTDLSMVTPAYITEKRRKLYDLILHLREIM